MSKSSHRSRNSQHALLLGYGSFGGRHYHFDKFWTRLSREWTCTNFWDCPDVLWQNEGSLVLPKKQRLLPGNPPLNAISIQCCSYRWSMHILQREVCKSLDVMFGMAFTWFIIFLVALGYMFGRASVSKHCCHVKCFPFVNRLPMDWWSSNLFKMVL